MSLFKICNWWTVRCPDIQGNYSPHTIVVFKLELKENEKDYIAVASQSGYLSIYYPSTQETQSHGSFGYNHSDLILECELKLPILGLVTGKFGSSIKYQEDSTLLAVLHPLSVAIYKVTQANIMNNFGIQSKLQLIVEYQLTKYNYSICKGNFGGIKNREFICVAHCDGSLTFFEQDGIIYSRNLVGNVTLPYPVMYETTSDAFLRINSNWELESFSYQDLSIPGSNCIVSARWSLCIGEAPLQMELVRVTNFRTNVMILGEMNLINISEGKVVFVKKLGFSPLCFHSFTLGWYWEADNRLITAVASKCGNLYLYENTTLLWIAKLEALPVAILRSNFSDLPGALVILYQNGFLNVSFLGSEPYMFHVPNVNIGSIKFEKAHKELVSLEQKIRKIDKLPDISVINEIAEKNIDLNISISGDLETCENGLCPMCRVLVNFRVNVKLEQLQFMFNTNDGIICSKRLITYRHIELGTTEQIDIVFVLSNNGQISSTKLDLIVSLIDNKDNPRVITRVYFLPCNTFYEIVALQTQIKKTTAIRLNFSEVLSPVDIYEAFGKLIETFKEERSDASLVKINNMQRTIENVITISPTNVDNWLEIQSNSMEAISSFAKLIMSENEIKKKGKGRFFVRNPIFPVMETAKRVLCHYEAVQQIKQRLLHMDTLWNQLNLFQERLQSKHESDSVNGLFALIDATYEDIINEGDLLIQRRLEKKRADGNLNVMLVLIQNKIKYLKADRKMLSEITPSFVHPIEDWIRMVDNLTTIFSYRILLSY